MNKDKLTITPIRETGDSRTGTLSATYDEIIAAVGRDNVSDMDDDYKVPASWAFQDQKGRKGFIWAYKLDKGDVPYNTYWSLDGDMSLLEELFPGKVS
jgi:hypothetical protein